MDVDRDRTTTRTTAFTIVEVIVAMALLGIGMVAVFGTLRTCAEAAHHARMLMHAVYLAERLLVEAGLEESPAYGTVKGQEERYVWNVRTAPTSVEDLGVICVRVNWPEQGRTQQYELLSFRYMKSLAQSNN
jgi:prepilin-type N-terminal cleavage/methylation domain-containing protein